LEPPDARKRVNSNNDVQQVRLAEAEQDTVMAQHTTFVKIISVLLIIHLIGCTSLQTIEAPPDKLQEQIRHENLIKVGDRVKIITEDQKEHEFVVTAINEDEIRGEGVNIPIDSVVAVQTREFSTGKTALLAGGIATGTILVIIFIAVAVAPAAILSASGG
jgi:hypothetical protein